jgi:iron complex outermembrane receptor protein
MARFPTFRSPPGRTHPRAAAILVEIGAAPPRSTASTETGLTHTSRPSLSRSLVSPALLAAFLSSAAIIAPSGAHSQEAPLPPVNVDSSRLASVGIVGASTSIITAEDIARSPGQTVQDVLATVPGVQLRSLYGGVNGAGTTVDLRGFGAFASANTLVLVNGRRINDLDLAGVDLSTIPLQSIERIEVTRGNSGAVLYGDNAVGGVINIITKTGASTGKPMTMRAEAGVGSFKQRFGSASATTNYGPWSTAVFANAINSDGYRKNNELSQRNGVGEVRYTTSDFSAFLNLSGDRQHLGLPGARATQEFGTGINRLATDPRGTSSPFDYGETQGANATAGFTKTLWAGAELIVDGGVRNKDSQTTFLGNVPLSPFGARSVDSSLQTWSITPRLSIKNDMFGLKSNILTGIDYYDATYGSSRGRYLADPAIHVYDLNQQSLAAYWQQTIGILPSTDISYGGRIQNTRVHAKDTLNPLAPNYFFLDQQANSLDKDETNHALHIGIEHRLNDTLTLFGRAARAFRLPNVDERVGASPIGAVGTFDVKTQTSYDVEGGVRIHRGPLDIQTSYYDMHLKNELHFDPIAFLDYNLDPTHRYGVETSASLRLSDTLLLKGGFAYTRAVFSEGPFAGNDVPLVSRLSGTAGVSWNVWQKYLVLDAAVRAWSARRMDNDQANFQPLIPANATLDLKISGEVDRFFWSFSVNNVFDVDYYDYSVASAVTPGSFNAYPLPGRTYMLKAGMTF